MAHGAPERVDGRVPCPVCEGEPRVLVVMQHPAMLRFTRELLERECGCWVATEVRTGPALSRALDRLSPDLLVIDAADFPACCFSALAHIRRDRVIVIGPEPNTSYRDVALLNGAGGWLARDDVADKLGDEMRRVLGCRHDPCPPAHAAHSRPRARRPARSDGSNRPSLRRVSGVAVRLQSLKNDWSADAYTPNEYGADDSVIDLTEST